MSKCKLKPKSSYKNEAKLKVQIKRHRVSKLRSPTLKFVAKLRSLRKYLTNIFGYKRKDHEDRFVKTIFNRTINQIMIINILYNLSNKYSNHYIIIKYVSYGTIHDSISSFKVF